MPELSRRQFLELAATSAVGAVMFTGCQAPVSEGLTESRVLLAEDTLTAYEDWYATTCRECPAGCGLIVRVVEGRARKIEGNPEHPVNGGKSCARGQAAVQAQYHPDRLHGPAENAGGLLAPLDWDTALDRVVARLREGNVVLITPPLRAHQALVVDRFTTALGAQWLTLDLTGEAAYRAAVQQVFGQSHLPDLALDEADFVLSFGADFLSTWLSPVRYSRQYGVFRQGSYGAGALSTRPRGHLVAIEPRFSVTAAAADEWLPSRPGSEGIVASSIAQELRGESGPYTPDFASDASGIAADRIRAVAQAFGAAQRPLAIGGGPIGAQTNGTQALSAVLGLNLLVNNPALRFGPAPAMPARPASSLNDWRDLADRLRSGQVRTVVVWDANPVYAVPSAVGLTTAVRDSRAQLVSFSSFMDETSAMADLLLPTHLPLEDWGSDMPEPAPPQMTLSLQQPLLSPLYDTRGFFDVVLLLASELGFGLPWPTFKDALRETAHGLPGADADFERFWTTLLQHGGSFGQTAAPQPLPRGTPTTAVSPAVFDGEHRFQLLLFPHHSLGDGEAAHLPWLQATPDPLTSVVWQTWVEVNPRVAQQMNLVEGDIVAVESDHGRVEVPVYVHPAAPPEVLAMPLGQGHRFGRWSKDRGVNPLQLVAPLVDADSGALAACATRVSMTRTGRHVGVPKMEGTVPAYQLPGHEVVKVSVS